MTEPCKWLRFVTGKKGVCVLYEDMYRGYTDVIDQPNRRFVFDVRNGDCVNHADCDMNPDEEGEE